jgi:putative sigma-54 modulation protein
MNRPIQGHKIIGGSSMKVKINSVHFDASDQLQEFVKMKVGKLGQFSDTILGAEVFLRVVKPQTNDNKIAEIRLEMPGNKLFAKKQASTFEQATDQSVEALRKQIRRKKEKLKQF